MDTNRPQIVRTDVVPRIERVMRAAAAADNRSPIIQRLVRIMEANAAAVASNEPPLIPRIERVMQNNQPRVIPRIDRVMRAAGNASPYGSLRAEANDSNTLGSNRCYGFRFQHTAKTVCSKDVHTRHK